MSTDNLTTSGWLLLIWTCIVAVSFAINLIAMISFRSDEARVQIWKRLGTAGTLLVIQLIWLHWLVS